MVKIAVIIGSTRPGRKSESVARWVHEKAGARTGAQYDLVDIKDFNLPLLDEAIPAAAGQYSQPHTKAWAKKIEQYDGFIFVTPEYNHGMPAALKNAIDFIYAEWNHKAAGIVALGVSNGVRAAEHLRGVAGNLKLAVVNPQVGFSVMMDWENGTTLKPNAMHEKMLGGLFEDLESWAGALKTVRGAKAGVSAAA